MADKRLTVTLVGKDEASRTFETVSNSSAKAASAMEGHAKRIGSAFSSLDNLLGQFGLPFTGALTAIGGKISDLEAKGKSSFQKLAEAGKVSALAIGAGAAAIAIESVHLADQFDKSQANLETAVKNSGGSMKQIQPIIDQQTDKFAKLGYTATQYEGALARATLGTGNAQKALSIMGLAADVAAFSHKDLESSATAVTKAMEGQLRPLKQLGIDLPIQAANAVQVQKAQDAVTKAAEAGRLVQEKVNDGRLKGANATDALRAAYEKIVTAQQTLNEKTTAGSQILDALHQKTLGAAIKQSETFQGQTKALGAELENMGIKIGLVLVPILQKLAAAMIDVINWFQKHKEAAIALGVIVGGFLVIALGAAIAAMSTTILVVGAVVVAIGLVAAGIYWVWTKWSDIWGWIETAAKNAADTITGDLQPIINVLNDIIGAANDVLGAISAVGGALGSISNGGNAFPGVSGALGPTSAPPQQVGGRGGGVGTPRRYAEGGWVDGAVGAPQLAVVHGGEFVLTPAMMAAGGGPLTVVIQLDGKTIGQSTIQHINRAAQGNPVIVKAAVRA